MNSAAAVEIERDLARWRRGQWVAFVLALLSIQGLLFFLAARPAPEVRTQYPPEPAVGFAPVAAPSEWLELQDASLFASANPHGFSGLAWMFEPIRNYASQDSPPGPSFLEYVRLHKDNSTPREIEPRMPHQRRKPEPTELSIPPVPPENSSRIEVAGFAHRPIIVLPNAPAQYATDAVKPTVVQSLVDADGIVLSVRVLESSGSKLVDNSAVDLARKARFAPLPSEQRDAISIGKMIFQWQTLDGSGTNAPSSKPVQK